MRFRVQEVQDLKDLNLKDLKGTQTCLPRDIDRDTYLLPRDIDRDINLPASGPKRPESRQESLEFGRLFLLSRHLGHLVVPEQP